MKAHQQAMISTIYHATGDGRWPMLTESLEHWIAYITQVRGALDRKKKVKLADIAATLGCSSEEADLHRFIFSVERYLEYRAMALLEIAVGESIEAEAPAYITKAIQDVTEVRKVFSTLPQSFLDRERNDASEVFESLQTGPFRDVFQDEFQRLVPRQVRHALGQFYTPPWLARHVLRSSGYRWEDKATVEQSVCDPACGSGVFLMAAAEEIRQAVQAASLSPAQGRELISGQLRGTDIESLPAVLACTNLTLASAAIARMEGVQAVGIVQSVLNEDSLDIRASGNTVDLVVGNPPWTNWEYMPSEFREKHIRLWPELGIYDEMGSRANSKEDISALFVAHAIRFRLRPEGRFGFVLPESLIKSAKNHRAFRRFRAGLLPEPYKVTLAEDFVRVRPFEGVANRTVVLYGVKGMATEYPLPFHKWTSLDRDHQEITGSASLIGEAEILVAKLAQDTDETSSWSTGTESSGRMHRILDGPNAYRGRTGLFTGGANAVFHLEHKATRGGKLVVQNVTERARRVVPQVKAELEPTFVFPFLRGRDVRQWHAESSIRVLLPHTVETRMRPVDEQTLLEVAPSTYSYLAGFRNILAERKGFSKWEELYREAGFYACQRVGEYTFAEWKVVWRYIATRFITAVVGPEIDPVTGIKPVIPNEKLMLIACSSKEEAFYLGGVLASAPVISHVHSRMVATQIPPSIVQNISIPIFSRSDTLHQEISRLCQEGHQAVAAGDSVKSHAIADAIDLAVSSLWGLDPDEVKAERAEVGY